MTQLRALHRSERVDIARRILEHCNVRLWPMDQIEAYKREQIEAHPPNWAWQMLTLLRLDPKQKYRHFATSLLDFAGSFAILAAIACFFWCITGLSMNTYYPHSIPTSLTEFHVGCGWSVLGCGVLALVCLGIRIADDYITVKGPACWIARDLCDIQTPLPLQVQRDITLLRAYGLTTRIRVWELIEPVTYGVLDPIITIDIANAQDIMEPHAFGVWDKDGNMVPIPA